MDMTRGAHRGALPATATNASVYGRVHGGAPVHGCASNGASVYGCTNGNASINGSRRRRTCVEAVSAVDVERSARGRKAVIGAGDGGRAAGEAREVGPVRAGEVEHVQLAHDCAGARRGGRCAPRSRTGARRLV